MREISKQKKLLHITAVVSAVILLAIGSVAAFLTDTDVRRNVVTLGSVKIQLDEDNYTDSQTLVPGQIIAKAPKLTNTGKNAAYVFLKIEVPKATVTLLDEQGKPCGQMPSKEQIFRLLADGTETETVAVPENQDIAIVYHAGTTDTDGWRLLDDLCDFAADSRDVYIFGYNRKLSPTDVTKTLFDAVQLKSLIDHENETAGQDMQIMVQGYAIQDKNLHIDGMNDSAEQPTDEQLKSIYEIVKRKAAQ